jgi:hypothetical protein
MASLRGTLILLFFVIIDLIIFTLLNTGSKVRVNNNTLSGNKTFYFNSFCNQSYTPNQNKSKTGQAFNNDDIIDVEFVTKD